MNRSRKHWTWQRLFSFFSAATLRATTVPNCSSAFNELTGIIPVNRRVSPLLNQHLMGHFERLWHISVTHTHTHMLIVFVYMLSIESSPLRRGWFRWWRLGILCVYESIVRRMLIHFDHIIGLKRRWWFFYFLILFHKLRTAALLVGPLVMGSEIFLVEHASSELPCAFFTLITILLIIIWIFIAPLKCEQTRVMNLEVFANSWTIAT